MDTDIGTFQVGDRVTIHPACDNPAFIEQFRHRAEGSLGTVQQVFGNEPEESWCWIKFDNGYRNNYPSYALMMESGKRMPEPEMSLDEICIANELFEEAGGKL